MQSSFTARAAAVIGSLALVTLGVFAPSADASFASALKRSYGGTLSTNTSISTQQLTADPDGIAKGSVSTEYDPALVTLKDIKAGPYFDIDALIGVRKDGEDFERYVSSTAFFAGLPFSYVETGYLQVAFVRHPDTTAQSVINPEPGYDVVATDGEINGDDTHALFFQMLTPNASTAALYRLYQEDGTKHRVIPDYLTNLDGQTFTSGITQAVVPEPVSLSLLCVGGALLLARRRR